MKNKFLILSTLFIGALSHGQTGSPPPYATNPSQAIVNSNFAWYRGGNVPGGQAVSNNILGTRWASNIWIMGNNEVTSFFSHNDGLNGLSNSGDGLRILNPNSGQAAGLGEIDIFTSGSNHTEIRWGGSGNIRGAFNRFEMQANYRGLYFNTREGQGIYKFARLDNVTAVIGTNNFWRIGMQTDAFPAINGTRRLEVVDNAPQFRLHYGPVNSVGGPFTDFLSNSSGNLQIMPSGQRVGINAISNPTATIDVFGDARIRNVQQVVAPDALIVGVTVGPLGDLNIRRLDFSGQANEVLLGNGTWGQAPGNITANNGVSRLGNVVRLGDQYLPLGPGVSNTPLTTNRQVRLGGNNLVFSGAGNVGIGLTFPVLPTERLDVDGNARFRNVPAQGGQSLILGMQLSANQNDVELSRLLIPNDATQVLLGNGTFGPLPGGGGGAITADNGLRMSPTTDNVQLGQLNSGTGALNGGELILNTEIPMNENNLYLYGSSSLSNNVYIGQPFGAFASNTFTRLNVYRETNQALNQSLAVGGMFTAQNTFAGSNTTVGIWSNVSEVAGTTGQTFAGGLFRVNGNGTGATFGITAASGGGDRMYGVHGVANGSGNANSFARGGHFAASGAETNYGVYASGQGGTTNYAGYFDGNVFIFGGITYGSDENLKNNIAPLNSGMSLINQLEPKTFEYDQAGYPSMNLSGGLQYGLIAQEVELILPELVSENIHPAKYDSLGNVIYAEVTFKGLNYDQLIPIMIKGMQEQQSNIDSLTVINITNSNYSDSLELVVIDINERLTLLENCLSNILNGLCQANSMAIQSTPDEIQEQLNSIIDVELSDRNSIVLNQNVPNPFAERTVISYTIPETVIKAQIHFYNGNGTLINSVDVIDRGNGELNVYANDLSSGVYTYSLVADGKIVSTKRMVKN